MGRTQTILAAVAALLLAAPTPPAAADAGAPAPVLYQPVYRPPVAGPVIDPFRPPSTPFGPGNRGIDYATTPGEPVAAPADGVVTFAGAVGGQLHVVILHADGIRTSLSFLAAVLVARGQQVGAGQPVGRAGASLHLGARRGDAYLDPATLFTAGAGGRSALVPDGPGRPLGAEEEAAGLRRLLAGVVPRAVPQAVGLVGGAARAAAGRSAAELEALARTAVAAGAPMGVATLAVGAAMVGEQGPCTPEGTPPPARPPGRRLLVLVGGLGSSSTSAAVFGVDAAVLGYAPGDVVRFSYRGGTTAQAPYGPADTFAGIDEPARRFAALLAELAATHPGQPIDVVAHSMGGLVARAALAPGAGAPPPPATLVTLATPHGGADLAAVGQLSAMTPTGRVASHGVAALPGLGLSPSSRSVADLAPGSAFLSRLAAAGPPPPLTRVAAIGSRTDFVVPPTRSRWPGMPSTVVDLPLGMAHDSLPRSAAATREIALAVGGAPPTCRSKPEAVLDAAASLAVQAGTYGLGTPAAVGLAAPLPAGAVPVPLASP